MIFAAWINAIEMRSNRRKILSYVCASVQIGFIALTIVCLPLPKNPVEVVDFRLECDFILNDVYTSFAVGNIQVYPTESIHLQHEYY